MKDKTMILLVNAAINALKAILEELDPAEKEKAYTREKCHQIIAEAQAKQQEEEKKKNEQAKSEGVNLNPDVKEDRMYSKKDLQAMFNVSTNVLNNWMYSFLRPVKPTIMKHKCYYTSDDVEQMRVLVNRHYNRKANTKNYQIKIKHECDTNIKDLMCNDYTRDYAENVMHDTDAAKEARERYEEAVKAEWPDVLPDSLKEEEDE